MEISGISVVVLGTAEAVAIRAQVEMAAVLKDRPDALISFSVADPFRIFLQDFERDAALGRIDTSRMRVTQVDEYLDFEVDQAGGVANELLQCAPLRQAFDDGRFVPLPSSGRATLLEEHQAHLQAAPLRAAVA